MDVTVIAGPSSRTETIDGLGDAGPVAKKLRLLPSEPEITQPVALPSSESTTLDNIHNLIALAHETPPTDAGQISSQFSQLMDVIQSGRCDVTHRLAAAHALLSVSLHPSTSNHSLNQVFSLLDDSAVPPTVRSVLLKLLHLACQTREPLKGKVVSKCLQLLNSSPHRLIQTGCLDVLGDLANVTSHATQMAGIFSKVAFFHDSRMRTAVLRCVHRLLARGAKMPLSVYYRCIELFRDDEENVRMMCIKIVCEFARSSPSSRVDLPGEPEGLNLLEHAFSRICELVNDIRVSVRVEAVASLGRFADLDVKFREQTLDKQLMSRLRAKRSSHQRASMLVKSGAYSSGRKWGDDQPLEDVDEDSVTLISTGACGAIIHGLEDEFKEVRVATVTSLSQLCVDSPVFARQALDYFIDMLNDEIETVRVVSIRSLAAITDHFVIRKDQLIDILSCLDDFSVVVREAVHDLLKSIRLETWECLKSALNSLLRNLKKYPADESSILTSLRFLGSKHSSLCLPMVKELLCVHPFLDTPEPMVDDPAYKAVMMLVFNCAKTCPSMVGLFPPFAPRHYLYLKELHPDLVPELRLNRNELQFCYTRPESLQPIDTQLLPEQTYSRVLDHLQKLPHISPHDRSSFINNLLQDLRILLVGDGYGRANFLSLSLRFNLNVYKAFDVLKRFTPTTEVALSDEIVFTFLSKSIVSTFALEASFLNATPEELRTVLQLRAKAATLLLFFTLRKRNLSLEEQTLICRSYLHNLSMFKDRFAGHEEELSDFCRQLLQQLLSVDPSKVGLILKFLHPLLMNSVDSSVLVPSSPDIQTCSAVINSPKPSTKVESFVAGLILAVDLDVTIRNVADTSCVRIVMTYPGNSDHVVAPPSDKFRQLSSAHTLHRLQTCCFISHSSWTEPGELSLAVFVAVPALFDCQLSTSRGEKLVRISNPVRLLIHPKPNTL